MNRRDVLLTASLVPVVAVASVEPVRGSPARTPAAKAPSLRIFDVRDFGATGDGRTLDHPAINRAIVACNAAGGGVVLVPPGVYHSGSIFLLSNVTLHVSAGATLLGSRDFADYTGATAVQANSPETSMAFDQDPRSTGGRHLITAERATNILVTGLGVIDGQGAAYWSRNNRPAVAPKDEWADVLAYDWTPAQQRPSPMIEFIGCRNAHVEQVRIVNSAGWTFRLLNCTDVHIRDLTIENPTYGPNTDGIDIVASENVFVTGCHIDTGDDAICLKSESLNGGPLAPTRNIVITNCVLTTGGNGLKIGTATFGRIEDVTFTNSVICNDPVNPKARAIAGLAIEMVDGGALEGVVVSNIAMRNVRTPIFIRRGGRHLRPDGTPGTLRGVRIDNVHAVGGMLASSVTGLPGAPVEDVSFTGVTLESLEEGSVQLGQRVIPEVLAVYPEARMFGKLPAFGLYVRHVRELTLRDVVFKAAAAEERSAVVADDVRELTIDGFRAYAAGAKAPTISLSNTRDALLTSCASDPIAPALVEIKGAATADVLVCSSKRRRSRPLLLVSREVPKDAVEQRP